MGLLDKLFGKNNDSEVTKEELANYLIEKRWAVKKDITILSIDRLLDITKGSVSELKVSLTQRFIIDLESFSDSYLKDHEEDILTVLIYFREQKFMNDLFEEDGRKTPLDLYANNSEVINNIILALKLDNKDLNFNKKNMDLYSYLMFEYMLCTSVSMFATAHNDHHFETSNVKERLDKKLVKEKDTEGGISTTNIKDLEFKKHSFMPSEVARIDFENGYGASVVKSHGIYQVAIFKGDQIYFDSSLDTDDMKDLSEVGVNFYLRRIEEFDNV